MQSGIAGSGSGSGSGIGGSGIGGSGISSSDGVSSRSQMPRSRSSSVIDRSKSSTNTKTSDLPGADCNTFEEDIVYVKKEYKK